MGIVDLRRIAPQQRRDPNARETKACPAETTSALPVTAYSQHQLLVMNLGTSAGQAGGQAEEIFRHGLAHLALDEASAERPLPRWLHAGFAVNFSEQAEIARFHELFFASLKHGLISPDQLDWHLPQPATAEGLAMAEAADFAAFLTVPERRGKFANLLAQVKQGTPFERAAAVAYGHPVNQLFRLWRVDVAKRKVFAPTLFGTLFVGVLAALGVWLRRRRAKVKRLQSAEAKTARVKPANSPELKMRVVTVRDGRPKLPKPESRQPPKAEPAELEVPKVSHEGRWHTLH